MQEPSDGSQGVLMHQIAYNMVRALMQEAALRYHLSLPAFLQGNPRQHRPLLQCYPRRRWQASQTRELFWTPSLKASLAICCHTARAASSPEPRSEGRKTTISSPNPGAKCASLRTEIAQPRARPNPLKFVPFCTDPIQIVNSRLFADDTPIGVDGGGDIFVSSARARTPHLCLARRWRAEGCISSWPDSSYLKR